MTLTVELTLDQIAQAIRRLSPGERIALLRLVSDQTTGGASNPEQFSTQFAERKTDYRTDRAELDLELAQAAEALLSDYRDDKELTSFTSLDAEGFHAEG